MSNGRIEQLGTPREVYFEPATSFVARFVGRINELPGSVTGDGVEVAGVRVGVHAPAEFGAGSAVIVMSRPEDLRVAALDGDATGLAGTVVSEHFEGSSSLLRVRLDRLDLLVDVQRGQDAAPLEPGDRVAVLVAAERAHVVAA
jgi:putative spermidine/putrescine transport system ATP-binding protein